MPWDLSPFAEAGLTPRTLELLLGEHDTDVRPRLERLWSYYRNPERARSAAGVPGLAASGGGGALAQARGLPDRLTGRDPERRAREIVIENDIRWRIDTLVEFLFGRPIRISSTAGDAGLRAEVDAALAGAWERSGGLGLLQDMALLGCIYGSADLVVRAGGAGGPSIELVEAPRAVPLLDPADYRRIAAYIIVAPRRRDAGLGEAPGERGAGTMTLLDRVRRRFGPSRSSEAQEDRIVEILSASHRQVYEGGRLVLDEPCALGELPVVHVQNSSQPHRYEGLGDVEPLIPLQDELNTRLSDRAYRVTLQSFNMYLAKGIDFGAGNPGGAGIRIAPGQVWMTDNPDAEIKAFGGDGHSPSEDRHIDEVREALDKTSGVSPVVIGVVRERLGHLSSENALRVTMTGILNRTARKRIAYGRGIERASRLILAALDAEGTLRTGEHDRGIRIEWPESLPVDETTRLHAALMKRDLGVPASRLLEELGYAAPSIGAAGSD